LEGLLIKKGFKCSKTANKIFLLWREDKNDKKPGAHNPEKARYFKPKEKRGQAFPPPYLPPVFASLIFLLFFFARPDKCLSVHRPKKGKGYGYREAKNTYLGFMETRQFYIFFRAA